MDKYYLIKSSTCTSDVGEIFPVKENETIESTLKNKCVTKNDILELSGLEYKYYKKLDKTERIQRNKNGIIKAISELYPGHKYKLRTNNKYLTVQILKKEDQDDDISFKCKQENGDDCDIQASSIDEIIQFDQGILAAISDPKFKRIEDIGVNVIDPFYINSIENGNEIRKIMYLNTKAGKKIINIKWRGFINGDLCVGCELANTSKYGTDGTFNDKKLFNCSDGKGILIPVNKLSKSCESNMHREILKFNGIFNRLIGDIKSINPECICCLEWLRNINKWPQLQIDSKIKYKNQDIYGTCKWIGLVNGIEAVGVEMNNESGGIKSQFNSNDLFFHMDSRVHLFTADYIEHDKCGEKPHFISDKIIDTNKISIVKPLKYSIDSLNILGNPAMIEIDNKIHIGEVKWLGMINNEKCVGLDMEDQFEYGMDGIIRNDIGFDCMRGHGLITPLTNIKFFKDGNINPQIPMDELIKPNKYLKCKENWNEFINERNITKDTFVFVKLKNEITEKKMKGTLRWRGLMNDIPVGIVELTRDHEYGTNGMFWRTQLLKCPNKRAIAVPWNNIYPYLPYEPKEIPKEDRIFSDIDINSVVKYNLVMNYERDLSGTVKWTGVDEDGKYFYGLEMDGKIPDGTDGQFNGQRLFQCRPGHGKLAPMINIGNDSRLTEEERKLELFDKYFLDLFKCSNNSDLEIRIIKDIFESKNERVIKSIIECKDHPLKLDVHQYLIPLLIEKENIQLIKLILNNCDLYPICSQTFFNLANLALKIDDENLFKCAIEKCQDKNALLENGETFLTNLLKGNNSEELINQIISQNIFDVHIKNKDEESPLILACKKAMPSIVEKTIPNSLSIIEKEKIFNVIFDVDDELGRLGKPLDGIKIIRNLIQKVPIKIKMECNICMVREINIVLQCGHTYCDVCIQQLVKCSFCNRDIGDFKKIFLPK